MDKEQFEILLAENKNALERFVYYRIPSTFVDISIDISPTWDEK